MAPPGAPVSPIRAPFLVRLSRRFGKDIVGRIPVAPARLTPGPATLSLCFDDFPRSAWQVAGPLLAALGVQASYYVSGGLLGQSPEGLPLCTEEDVVAAFAAGHEIGCHTYAHCRASCTPIEAFVDSLTRNDAFLRARLPGWSARSFAFPYGCTTLASRRAVAARFGVGRSTMPGLHRGWVDRSMLRAVGLERDRGGVDVEAMVEEAARQGAWLILYTHDVAEQPSPFGCTPDELGRVLRRALAAGMAVRPVGAILERLEPAR